MKKKTGEKAETEAKFDQNRRKINKNIKKTLSKAFREEKNFLPPLDSNRRPLERDAALRRYRMRGVAGLNPLEGENFFPLLVAS